MDTILNLLLDPKVVSLLSFPIIVCLVEAYCIYKLYLRNSDLQDRLLELSKDTTKLYTELSTKIHETLQTLISVLGRE